MLKIQYNHHHLLNYPCPVKTGWFYSSCPFLVDFSRALFFSLLLMFMVTFVYTYIWNVGSDMFLLAIFGAGFTFFQSLLIK